MKYFVKLFVVTFMLIFCIHASAEQKIVVLNLKEVLNTSKAGKGAQDFLKKKFATNQKKYSNIEKELKGNEASLLKNKSTMSTEDYKKQSLELREKVLKYQSDKRKSLEEIAKQRALARSELLKKIDPILGTFVKENGISLVLDQMNIVAGSAEFDITSLIIKELNKELPSLNLK
jgi:outer membrane protein